MKRLTLYLMRRRMRNAINTMTKYQNEGEEMFAKAHRVQVDAYAKTILFLEAELKK